MFRTTIENITYKKLHSIGGKIFSIPSFIFTKTHCRGIAQQIFTTVSLNHDFNQRHWFRNFAYSPLILESGFCF